MMKKRKMETKKTIQLNSVLKELNIPLDKAVDYLNKNGFKIDTNLTSEIPEEIYQVLIDGFQLKSSQVEPLKKKKKTVKTKKGNLDYITKPIAKAPLKSAGDEIILNEFFSSLGNRNYFLAGHIWGDGKNTTDHLHRFMEDSIWENGHEKIGTTIVNSTQKNDIIFLKSSFQSNGISYLRIKAIGLIKENLNDGHNLKVKWHHRKPIDIEGLEKYRRTIVKVTKNDVPIIASALLKEVPNLLEVIQALNEELEENTTTIAGLISDTDSGADHLNIDNDITAFARVMAAKSFSPPLAIALLGKWGSGKSFFMRKLIEKIQVLSSLNTSESMYCKGVAHVHFNAWSYMDSNLWAGIITKIFEGLQEYISNDTKAKKQKRKVEKALMQRLNTTQEELLDLENKKQEFTQEIERLKKQQESAEKNLEKSIGSIKKESLKRILKQVDTNFKTEDKIAGILEEHTVFNQSKDNFSKIIPKKYWSNPVELYERTTSTITFIKTFFTSPKWYWNATWIVAIVLIGMFTSNTLSEFGYIASSIVAFITRSFTTVKKLRPVVASFWKLKEDYVLEKENALFAFQQREKSVQLEIENYKNEIKNIKITIDSTKKIKKDINYRIENALSTEALFGFIEKRAKSKDYKKHLGIVSVIRKDFEILSDLFLGHIEENDSSDKFTDNFENAVERIVLYVDDLDRCSQDRVVEVLEAVNLLMAFPLFVVVVGVDPRWVKKALNEKHKLQFEVNGNITDKNEIIEPSNYLEKIFQVPFHLKNADDTSVKYMLKTLAETHPPEIEESNNDNSIDTEFGKEKPLQTESGTIKTTPIVRKTVPKEKAALLTFTKIETELIQEMSEIIGPSPRAIKRFVNIYRIIKAHGDFNSVAEMSSEEILAVLFLIALPLGKYKKTMHTFNEYIQIEDTSLLLSEYLYSYGSYTKFQKMDKEVYDKDKSIREDLNKLLKSNNSSLLEIPSNVFLKYAPFIQRFSFDFKNT